MLRPLARRRPQRNYLLEPKSLQLDHLAWVADRVRHAAGLADWNVEGAVHVRADPELSTSLFHQPSRSFTQQQTFPATALGDKEGLAAEQIRQRGKALHEIVSGFVHPTLQRLLLPIERGGFYETKVVPSLAFIVWMLMDLTLNYTVSVAFLSTDSKTGIPPELTHANERLESVAATVGDLSFDEIVARQTG